MRYHAKGTRKGWELIVLHIVVPSSVLTLSVRYHFAMCLPLPPDCSCPTTEVWSKNSGKGTELRHKCDSGS